MKSTGFLALAIGIIVIGGAIALLNKGGKSDSNSVASQEEETRSEDSRSFNGSMRDLAARNESLKCTFSHSSPQGDSSGTVYIADGKVRGDFDVRVASIGSSFQTYMIADGETSYVWSSAIDQGFKIPLSDASAQTSASPANGVDYNQNLDYSCESWNPDPSLFIPPSSITFTATPTSVSY